MTKEEADYNANANELQGHKAALSTKPELGYSLGVQTNYKIRLMRSLGSVLKYSARAAARLCLNALRRSLTAVKLHAGYLL